MKAAGRDRLQPGEAFAQPNPWRRWSRSAAPCPLRRRRQPPPKSRIAASSGGAAKWTVTRHWPCPLSTRLTAISSAAKLSANRSATRRAACSSVVSVPARYRRQRWASAEFIAGRRFSKFSTAIHRTACAAPLFPANRKIFTSRSTALFVAFPQPLSQYFHGIPAHSPLSTTRPSDRRLRRAVRCS